MGYESDSLATPGGSETLRNNSGLVMAVDESPEMLTELPAM